MFICKVNEFGQGNPDKNGKMPVYLECKNGELPVRARVLSGTIAENLGLKVDSIYALDVTYTGDGDYGPQYRHKIFAAVNIVEYAQLMQNPPKPTLLFDLKKTTEPKVEAKVTVEEGDDADF
jgi:hypothetical protein